MNDMSKVIVPKSDQLNSDDLIGGTRTITITDVDIRPGTEQPVSIFFDGDNGKPWKPCKSMSRVMVSAWGPDAKVYKGRSLTLYRDPKVKWGGMEVGGIRVSHMSHIERDMVMALTATKGKRAPYTVRPLAQDKVAKPDDDKAEKWSVGYIASIGKCTTPEALNELIESKAETFNALQDNRGDLAAKCRDAVNKKLAELMSGDDEEDGETK